MTAGLAKKSNSVSCILNGTSGSEKAREASAQLPELFARHGVQAQILLASTGNEITALARHLVEDGHALVVVGGGDGTVSAVATAMVGTGSSLGVLPLGTLNHFAKDLKIPLALEAAVDNIFSGRVVRVDVGEVNGLTFLNNSSLGLYPTIVREREGQQRKGHTKWMAFAEATFFTLRSYSPLYLRLQMENQPELVDSSPFVFVGNNRYQTTGLHFGQREHLDAGLLWVYRAPRATRWQLFWLALQASMGKRVLGDLEATETEEFWISAKKERLNVANDGEVIALKTALSRPFTCVKRYRSNRDKPQIPDLTEERVAHSCPYLGPSLRPLGRRHSDGPYDFDCRGQTGCRGCFGRCDAARAGPRICCCAQILGHTSYPSDCCSGQSRCSSLQLDFQIADSSEEVPRSHQPRFGALLRR